MQTTSNRDIEKGYINGPEGKIHYWTIGQGEAILFIHQSSSTGEEYARLIPYLSDSYQLIAFDWPGHGNSDDPDYELGVEEYTESAVAVLDHLDIDKCHVLGHHGGALLAMNIAYLYPDRVGKLILSGTSGPKSKEETEAFKNNLPVKTRKPIDKTGDAIINTWKRYVEYIPSSSAKEILTPYINNLSSRLRPFDAHYGVLKWDREAALHSLKMPVLLIQGTLDTFVSRQEKLLDIIPNSERAVIENGGAFLFFEMAQESAQEIGAFLDK